MSAVAIPITVLGGYLGAGKTTVLNRMLANPGGRRLGVIVNDFGSLAIDVELLAGAGAGDIVSLANGCVCCTLGGDFHEALRSLAASSPPPDHIVIEASGVADPAVAAAWGTSAGFEPGGVIVLVAADAVRRQAKDRYIGGEVLRQLAGADVLVVTKTDLCDRDDRRALDGWFDDVAAGTPRVVAVDGELPIAVVLGVQPGSTGTVAAHATGAADAAAHADRYVTWSATCGAVDAATLDALLDDPPAGLLRLKGFVELTGGQQQLVQLVGRTSSRTGRFREAHPAAISGTQVVAIGIRDVLDVGVLDRCFR